MITHSYIGVAFNGRFWYGISSVVFESNICMGIRPAHRMLSAKVVRYSTILGFIKIWPGLGCSPYLEIAWPHIISYNGLAQDLIMRFNYV